MTRDDIIRIVRQVGMTNGGFLISGTVDELQEFAALVAAAERNKLADEGWRQCAKGQRTTQHCALLEAAVLAEREACAKVAESYEPRCEVCPSGVSNAILARRI